MQPPNRIDGAQVIEWAWSGEKPFGVVLGSEPTKIFGLAIATYDGVQFYRLACDEQWNSIQDALYDSIEDAKERLPKQYRNEKAKWQAMR